MRKEDESIYLEKANENDNQLQPPKTLQRFADQEPGDYNDLIRLYYMCRRQQICPIMA